jgi:dienelactone hydrolase
LFFQGEEGTLMRILIVLLFCVCVSATAFCQDPPKDEGPKVGGPFEVELVKPPAKYWLYVPNNYEAFRAWPMLVILHGAGDTAENFIKSFYLEASTNNYLVCAAKSSGDAWAESDGDMICGVMDDVRKTYKVDADRTFLVGYSSGGFMSSSFGIKNQERFRGMALIAGADIQGAKTYDKAKARLCVLVVCGTLDPNLQVCQTSYDKLKKDKFDCEFNKIEGMEHSPMKPEVIPWIFQKFEERCAKMEDLMVRAKKAVPEKRYWDALRCYKAIISNSKKGDRYEKFATAEMDKLIKIGMEEVKKLNLKDVQDKPRALEAVNNLLKQFEGTEVASYAQDRLSDITSEGR